MATIEAVPLQRPLEDEPVAEGGSSIEDGRLVVPRADYLALGLPRRPATRRDLLSMLRETSPLDPARTAWTDPWIERDGTVRVALARRDALDMMVAAAEDGRIRVEEVCAEQSGQRFDYRTPAQRRRTAITAICVGGAAAILLVGLFIRASDEPAVPGASAVPTQTSAGLGSVFSERSLAGEIASVAEAIDPAVRPSRIERTKEGTLVLTVATGDPDGTREAIDAGGSLPGFYEGGQARTAPGRYAITYVRPALALDRRSQRSQALQVPDRERALAQVRASLRGLPGAHRLRFGSADPRSQREGLLVLPLELSGAQADVLLAAQRIEGVPPPMRFVEWSLEPEGEGVRLSGLLQVPWQRTPS